jgi:hypothetical protein
MVAARLLQKLVFWASPMPRRGGFSPAAAGRFVAECLEKPRCGAE